MAHADARSWLQSAAAIWSPPPAAAGVSGIIWIEGSDLPSSQTLEPIVQAALEHALTGTGPGQPERPLVRLSGARTNGSTTRWCFEVSPVLPYSEKGSADREMLADARDVMASRLQSEASCRGSARLLPALVEQLDESCIACGRCRLRLELDEAVGSRPSDGWAEAPARDGEMAIPEALSCWVPQVRLPQWGASGLDFARASHSAAAAATRSSSQDLPQTPPSPTAMNLARDPELRARAMAGAVSFDSELGRRLSSGKCHTRASTATSPQAENNERIAV